MLVLTRRRSEEIVINGNIVIAVLSIHENSVRFGIAAPDSVRIQRREIYEQNQARKDPQTERNPTP